MGTCHFKHREGDRMNAIKTLSAAALVLSAGLAAVPAQASDVRWSVQIGLPLPVVTVPVPVYPARVYRPEPLPVYGAPAWRDRDRDGIADWRDPYDNRRGWAPPAWRDRDRDGVPDWRDHYDNRRGHAQQWHRGPDRDRDGVPDWRDRRDDRRDDGRDDRYRRY
jgi:hypothetical protein